MKSSRYNVYVDDFPEAGECIVYNTLSDTEAAIPNELKAIIESLPCPVEDPDAAEALEALKSLQIVLDDDVDETARLLTFYDNMRSSVDQLGITVLTTFDCNLACTYCIEEGSKSHVRMSPDTTSSAIGYIIDELDSRKPRSLSLRFYGGEPLMNIEPIRTLSRAAMDACEVRNIEFSSIITSNGVLLKRSLIEELVPLGLRSVRTTLDGTRSFHDKTRPFLNGRGTFDIILENIASIADLVKVYLGGNFTLDNVNGMYDLVDYLADKGFADKIASIGFKPVLPDQQARSGHGAAADLGCVFSDEAIMQHMVALRRKCLERGFTADPAVGVNLCSMIISGGHPVIDPEGNLYQCPAFVGMKDFAFGSISEPQKGGIEPFEHWKECADCAYAPLCGDGCLYASYVRFGDYSKLNCQKAFMEYVLRENIKLEYEFELPDET